jgi:hypothetical protein
MASVEAIKEVNELAERQVQKMPPSKLRDYIKSETKRSIIKLIDQDLITLRNQIKERLEERFPDLDQETIAKIIYG